MPVKTEPLSMSMAPSREYLLGWNDCHKHMAEEIVRQDTKIEALGAECSSWLRVVGHILNTIPTSGVIRASGTVGDSIKYFEGLHSERDRYRAALESILWQTKDCNGILFKAVHATANEALGE